MVQQNLFLCMTMSAIAGIFTIAAKAVVIYMARRRKQQQQQQLPTLTKVQKAALICLYLIFMAIANASTFFAPWFGPVSIYWPTSIASQLLSNMIIIGFLMGHETIDKNVQVATLIVVTAVLYIAINGPETQDNQDIQELILSNPFALIWLAILGLAYSVCTICQATGWMLKGSPAFTEMILFIIAICSSTLSATASRASSTLDGSEGPYRTILIAVTWFIIVSWSISGFMEAAYVRSLARYIPQVTFGSVILNALTGLIVWGDYNVILSWPGYITAVMLLGIGVYLISDLDFFKVQAQEQQEYFQREQQQERLQQLDTIKDFFSEIEEDLNQARLERTLHRHQVTIIENTARQGLTRGASDPEIGNISRSSLYDDEDDLLDSEEEDGSHTSDHDGEGGDKFVQEAVCGASLSPSVSSSSIYDRNRLLLLSPGGSVGSHKSRRKLGRTKGRSSRRLESVDALSQRFMGLKDLVGITLVDNKKTDSHGGDEDDSTTTTQEPQTLDGTNKSIMSDVSFHRGGGGGSDMDSISTCSTSIMPRSSSSSSLLLLNSQHKLFRQSSGLLELSRSNHRPARPTLQRMKKTGLDLKMIDHDGDDYQEDDLEQGRCGDSAGDPEISHSIVVCDGAGDGEENSNKNESSSMIQEYDRNHDQEPDYITQKVNEIMDEIQVLAAAGSGVDRPPHIVEEILACSQNIDDGMKPLESCVVFVEDISSTDDEGQVNKQSGVNSASSSIRTTTTTTSTTTLSSSEEDGSSEDEQELETRMDEIMDTIRSM